MRILLASDHYPPFVGGAQRQTRVLAAELKLRGHDVWVATVWQDGLPARSTDGDVPVFRLHQLRTLPLVRGRARRRHQPPFPDPVTVFELHRLVNELDPELIHAAGWFAYSCALALRASPTPLLVSARDYGFSCANSTLLHQGSACSGPALKKCLACAGNYYGVPKGWLATLGVLGSRRLLGCRIDGLHSVSQFVSAITDRDFLTFAERARTARATIPSFRVEDQGPQDRLQLARLPDEPYILFVGALRRVKGIEALLSAYARLSSPPRLVLLGTDEPDTPDCTLPGVLKVGPMPHWAVMEAWERCLFGVMPSLWPEPLGSTVHEAMSRGRAVIGSTLGGHADMIVHGETGLLVAPGEVGALAAAMRRLIEDPQFRDALGQRALERSRLFDAAAVLPSFEAFYSRLVADGRRGERREPLAEVRARR